MAEQEVDTYEKALDTVQGLHPAPQILAQASSKMRDPNVDVDDIVELIRADAGLTADIIRISNSAFYGFETKSSNLQDSIGRIGFNEITRLIGMSMSKELFNRNLSHYKTSSDDYWALSVSTALVLEKLSRMHGENPNDAYTVGLLHCVGRIVLNQIMDDYSVNEVWDGSTPVGEWEREVIGFTYAYAGAMILKRWDFAAKITHPILYQLNAPKAELGWSLHAYLYFARKLLDQTKPGFENQEFDIEPIAEWLDILMLQEDDIRNLVRESRDTFLLVKRSLGM